LLIEAKFIEKVDATKACQDGVTMATPSIENAEKRLTKVKLTRLPLEHQDEIKAGLIHSMEKYGQVCQSNCTQQREDTLKVKLQCCSTKSSFALVTVTESRKQPNY
jgi:hypothetical protein